MEKQHNNIKYSNDMCQWQYVLSIVQLSAYCIIYVLPTKWLLLLILIVPYELESSKMMTTIAFDFDKTFV